MNQIQTKLDNGFSVFEQGLNMAGYVPILGVSKVAGLVRINFGNAQIIASIALGALIAVAALFSKNADERQQGLHLAVTIMKTYTLHGLANMGRGFIECVPYLSLVTCLPYDLMDNRYRYPNEVPGRWEYVREVRA